MDVASVRVPAKLNSQSVGVDTSFFDNFMRLFEERDELGL